MSLLVGLTGGIASGKSSAGEIFLELGVHMIDADRVSRDLVAPSMPALEEIVKVFGPAILGEDGSLNRTALGDMIFADTEKRLVLERILHPPIAEEIDRRVADLRRKFPEGIIMVDAALTIEAGNQHRYECLIVVCAGEETQLRRLMERNGIGSVEARRKIEAQMPLAEKIAYADFVIDNDGSEEELRAEVERVFRELEKLRLARHDAQA
jgi:dephospho-CoA kinase